MSRFALALLLISLASVSLPVAAIGAKSAPAANAVDARYNDPDLAASYVPLSLVTTERASRRMSAGSGRDGLLRFAHGRHRHP